MSRSIPQHILSTVDTTPPPGASVATSHGDSATAPPGDSATSPSPTIAALHPARGHRFLRPQPAHHAAAALGLSCSTGCAPRRPRSPAAQAVRHAATALGLSRSTGRAPRFANGGNHVSGIGFMVSEQLRKIMVPPSMRAISSVLHAIKCV
ncbi:uncharacterized protein LOC110433393 isoform X1 [Sorghum bicolor]|uniref:uncharacterized protein LOC110433393 isoform X1 n=1 Tax=Sorghum bicolor TaxID=4558 RepID=UPI000B424DFD|nr:uncharacterized protein LOC110433393 isoform X1 [Sorghum bicolor]|eukprot:XP_021311075.1 uncharacterized protein LOC110433393 isoform X1 [Sorghum bicolor]